MKAFVTICTLAIAAALEVHAADSHTLTFGGPDNSEFLLDGKPFQLRAGEIDPGRVPHEYWRHSIQMAKAMGLNTIACYVFWNQHEAEEGKFDFSTGERNIGDFFKIAREEGMWILLRPGPYICGEWDFGGLPWWLLRTPDIKLRCMDPRYTKPIEPYIHELAKVIRPNMAENGGSIIMVQIENEYGSYQRRDHNYMVWLRDLWVKEGVRGPFSTADGAGANYLKNVVIPGVAVGLDTGESQAQFDLAHKLNPGVPVFTSEFYPGWLRHWGESNWGPQDVSRLLKFYMDTGKSFSMYMFHGGTNFGLTAGANDYKPSITSYDYGAPLNEQGCPTPAYMAIRKQLASYLPEGTTLPDIPANIPTMEIPEIVMERWTSLWEQMPAPVTAAQPMCMEALGQNQGIVIYRATVPPDSKGPLKVDTRNYSEVFCNGRLLSVIDRRIGLPDVPLPDAGDKASTVDILAEGTGHINFQSNMESDRKGIIGPVKLGDAVLSNWQMYCYPLSDEWAMSLKKTMQADKHPGGIFKGEFSLDTVADTYLDMSGYTKGYVWVNGHNLGRYWSIGPQQRLYCPAPWLKTGSNEIVVLDLQQTAPAPIAGVKSANAISNPLKGRTAKVDASTPFEMNVPANTVSTKDYPCPKDTTLAAAHLNPMKDEGQAWGVGLALGWADGKYVQVNVRTDGEWSIRRDGAETLTPGCPKAAPSTVVIKLTSNVIQIMALPDGAADWNLLAEIPRQDAYAGAPATVRIGKIGNTWQAQDYPQRGTSNTCRVDWLRIY